MWFFFLLLKSVLVLPGLGIIWYKCTMSPVSLRHCWLFVIIWLYINFIDYIALEDFSIRDTSTKRNNKNTIVKLQASYDGCTLKCSVCLETLFHGFILYHIRHFYLTWNSKVLTKSSLMPLASRNNMQKFLTPFAVPYLSFLHLFKQEAELHLTLHCSGPRWQTGLLLHTDLLQTENTSLCLSISKYLGV